MALRDQPYLPLYVQDFLTDEKLMECSPAATGVYIRIMCVMHKSDPYGTILLKQKDKQSNDQIINFAEKLAKHLPYSCSSIYQGITELISEGVLQVVGDLLVQKRMVRDNELSIKRSRAGSRGGFATAKKTAKGIANTENETEDETVTDTINKEEVINYSLIVENYHLYCPKLRKVIKLSDERKKHVAARFKEFNLEVIIDVFKAVGLSDFLNGKNDRLWKADFDWIFNPTNFIKITEGKYSNVKKAEKLVMP